MKNPGIRWSDWLDASLDSAQCFLYLVGQRKILDAGQSLLGKSKGGASGLKSSPPLPGRQNYLFNINYNQYL